MYYISEIGFCILWWSMALIKLMRISCEFSEPNTYLKIKSFLRLIPVKFNSPINSPTKNVYNTQK
jgi:hypothetical protein